jgi:hypothetical protein
MVTRASIRIERKLKQPPAEHDIYYFPSPSDKGGRYPIAATYLLPEEKKPKKTVASKEVIATEKSSLKLLMR